MQAAIMAEARVLLNDRTRHLTERVRLALLAELAQRFEVSEDEFLPSLREVVVLLPRLREPFVVGEAVWI